MKVMGVYYTENLKCIRLNRELTQAAVADAIGVGREQYRRYETGQNQLPLCHLLSLCRFYGISADTILGLPDTLSRDLRYIP